MSVLVAVYRLPLASVPVAVTITGFEPLAACALPVTVSNAVPLPGAAMPAEAKVAVTPVGSPLTERTTDALNPPCGVTVTNSETALVRWIASLSGERETLIPGATCT